MLSLEKKIIFIHIPKTGGNSVQRVLAEYSEDKIIVFNRIDEEKRYRGRGKSGFKNPVPQDGEDRFGVANLQYGLKKHATLAEYKNALADEIYNNMYKFSILRNPWDRAISFYFSPHRGNVIWSREDFVNFVKIKMLPVRSYIHQDVTKIDEQLNGGTLNKDIDFLLKFETLASDFKIVCDEIGVDYKPLPTLNKNPKKHYSYYYDDALKDMIIEKFSDEIEFGGYEFNMDG
jgi:hypothetical protein